MARHRNPELDERRELLARMTKNAGRKVSRLKAKGVNIEGTKYDGRVSLDKIGKYNMAQLNNAENKLREFNARGTTFYKMADDSIITAKDWREYKHVEHLANARGKRWDNSVGDVYIKQSGMTVKERKENVKASRIRAAGESTPRLFVENNLRPEQVNGIKALNKLIAQQKKRLRKDYVHEEVKKGRVAFNSMLNAMGNLALVADLNKLTDHQFAILVKETNFADSVGLKYTTLAQMASEDEKKGQHGTYLDSVADTETESIRDYLQTAQSYPAARSTKKIKGKNK